MDATAILIVGSIGILLAFMVFKLARYAQEYNEKLIREKQALADCVSKCGWRIQYPEKGDIEWIISGPKWSLEYDTDRSSDSSTPKLIFKSDIPAAQGKRFAVISENGLKMMTHPMFKNAAAGIEKFAKFAGMKDAATQINEVLEILQRQHISEIGSTSTQKMMLIAESTDTIYHLKHIEFSRQFQSTFSEEKVRLHENNTRVAWLNSGLEIQQYLSSPTQDHVRKMVALGELLLSSK